MKAPTYRWGKPRGPSPARLMIVGEAFGSEEARLGIPFVGASGKELGRMLNDAGILESDCRMTNVANLRPPENKVSAWFATSRKAATLDGLPTVAGKYPRQQITQGIERLREEIRSTNPDVIVALGNTALWALTGEWGITDWRGSLLTTNGGPASPEGFHATVIPTYHPAAILRQWSWRHIAVHDLRYARAYLEEPVPEPLWRFTIRPTFEQVTEQLRWIESTLDSGHTRRLAVDIETRTGQIACLGIAWSTVEALCIPFLCAERIEGYWDLEQEVDIVMQLRRILQHRNAEIVGQNYIYDMQYIWDNWKFISNVTHDTMLMQHTVFPGLPKGLDFLASVYCEYRRFWKNEGKFWDPKKVSEDVLWRYNCTDAVRTFEIAEPLLRTIKHMKVENVYEHSMALYEPVLFMMLNGIAIDTQARAQMALDMTVAATQLDDWLRFVLGERFNPRSTPQMRRLFYDEIGVPAIRNRKTGQPTLGKDALEMIRDKNPLLSPLIDRILLRRSIGVFFGTFLEAALDPDNRMRCSYNIAGTETGRFSSSENAFGRGTNLENIPRPAGKHEAESTPIVRLPNIRSLFRPDPGHVIADFDLDRADAHIVAWEAGDAKLKELFRRGEDIHAANARVIGSTRQLAKGFVHGTNYGGGPRVIARACGISVTAAEAAQAKWFAAHPNIREWHERIEYEVQTKRRVVTVFGRVRFYFDRIEKPIINQALAYLGQSPVADVINKGLRRIYDELPWCQLLLQNHDSVVVQLPDDCLPERLADIRRRLLIPVPYPDSLVIPVGCKYSRESWGHLKEWKFK